MGVAFCTERKCKVAQVTTIRGNWAYDKYRIIRRGREWL